MTDACLLIGILDAERLPRRRDDARRRSSRARPSRPRTPAQPRAAGRVRLPDRPQQHRRGHRRHRDPARHRPARLHAWSPSAPPGRCCCRRCSTRSTRRGSSCRRTPACSSALGLLSADLVYSDSRSAYTMLDPDAAPHDRRGLRGDGGRAARRARAPAPSASTFGAASTPASSARPGRRRSSPVPGGTDRRAARSSTMIADFHDDYERAQRQPLRRRFPVAGRHLPRRSSPCRPTRSTTAPLAGEHGRRRRPTRTLAAAPPHGDEPSRRREYERDDAARRRRVPARRSSASRCRPPRRRRPDRDGRRATARSSSSARS